jgi:hypothetical protein
LRLSVKKTTFQKLQKYSGTLSGSYIKLHHGRVLAIRPLPGVTNPQRKPKIEFG